MNERKNASGTVTIVTGPIGVDVGPVAARLGQGLRDGLAIRTIAAGGSTQASSPLPYDAIHTPTGRRVQPNRVLLYTLPSAWQNPDTNLGIAYEVQNSPLLGNVDLPRLDLLGLHPGHRVTVQSPTRSTIHVPPPVEVGNLAEAARDSVLRTGGRVLIQAGDGQTAQDALQIVGLPPWSAHIRRLDIWIVLDAQLALDRTAGLNEAAAHARGHLLNTAAAEVRRNGGPFADPDETGAVNLWLAVTNAHTLPGLEGLAGFDSVVGDDELERQLEHGSATAVALGELLDEFRDKTGTFPMLLGTGWPSGGPTFFDLLGDHGDRPAD